MGDLKVKSYVIIDDDSDMLGIQMDRFVKVDGRNGLSIQNYRDAIQILGRDMSLDEEYAILEAVPSKEEWYE